MTRVTDRSISTAYTWLHDNRHIVFFREQGGDENWQAHRVDLDTGDIRPLSPGPGVSARISPLSTSIRWACQFSSPPCSRKNTT